MAGGEQATGPFLLDTWGALVTIVVLHPVGGRAEVRIPIIDFPGRPAFGALVIAFTGWSLGLRVAVSIQTNSLISQTLILDIFSRSGQQARHGYSAMTLPRDELWCSNTTDAGERHKAAE